MYNSLIQTQLEQKVSDFLSLKSQYINLLSVAYVVKFQRDGLLIETPKLSADATLAHRQLQCNYQDIQIDKVYHITEDPATKGLILLPEIVEYAKPYAEMFLKLAGTEPELTTIETGFTIDHSIDHLAKPGQYFVRFAWL